MITKTITVNNEDGLHMRPAGTIAKEAGKFECDVTILYDDKRINAKSLINIIAASIKCGAKITFECDGADETQAMEKLEELIADNFCE